MQGWRIHHNEASEFSGPAVVSGLHQNMDRVLPSGLPLSRLGGSIMYVAASRNLRRDGRSSLLPVHRHVGYAKSHGIRTNGHTEGTSVKADHCTVDPTSWRQRNVS